MYIATVSGYTYSESIGLAVVDVHRKLYLVVLVWVHTMNEFSFFKNEIENFANFLNKPEVKLFPMQIYRIYTTTTNHTNFATSSDHNLQSAADWWGDHILTKFSCFINL